MSSIGLPLAPEGCYNSRNIRDRGCRLGFKSRLVKALPAPHKGRDVMREAEKLFGTALAEEHSLPEYLLLSALDYLIDDRVESGLSFSGWAAARVRGFTDVYQVSTALASPWRGACTCGRPTPCRHQAAVVLALHRQPDRFLSLDLDPLRDLDSAVWASTVFRLLAHDPDPLAPLREALRPDRSEKTNRSRDEAAEPTSPDSLDLASLVERVRAVSDRDAKSAGAPDLRDGETDGSPLAQDLRERVAAGPVREEDAPFVESLVSAALGGLPHSLESAVRALCLSMGDPEPLPVTRSLASSPEDLAVAAHVEASAPLMRAVACLEKTLWQSASLPRRGSMRPEESLEADRAYRAADFLIEWIRSYRSPPEDAVRHFLETHAVLMAVTPWIARDLFERGSDERAERIAAQAYVNTSGLGYRALRSLLLDMVRAGRESPRRWLLSEWEASPVRSSRSSTGAPASGRVLDPDESLKEIMDALPTEARGEVRAHAEAILARFHAYASLARLALREGRVQEAARWALFEGPRAADPDLCLALVKPVLNGDGPSRSGEEPPEDSPRDQVSGSRGSALTAIELLSAAFRRESDGRRQQEMVKEARALVRQESGLRGSWQSVRRRYFQTAPVLARSPKS